MCRLGFACLAVALIPGCDQSYRPAPKEGDAPAGKAAPFVEQSPTSNETIGDADALGTAVVAARIRLKAPETWLRRPPHSQFVLADFALPKTAGDDQDGRLTVSVAGGTIEANLQRWRDQFSGDHASSGVKELDVDGVKVTVIDLSGTFNDQPGPFAKSEKRDGYRMLAAIATVDGQLHFIKATGPAKTIAQHESAYYSFLRTIEIR